MLLTLTEVADAKCWVVSAGAACLRTGADDFGGLAGDDLFARVFLDVGVTANSTAASSRRAVASSGVIRISSPSSHAELSVASTSPGLCAGLRAREGLGLVSGEIDGGRRRPLSRRLREFLRGVLRLGERELTGDEVLNNSLG
jgi:hypothetical protein